MSSDYKQQLIEDLMFIKIVLSNLVVDSDNCDFGPALYMQEQDKKLANKLLTNIINVLKKN